MPKTLPAQIPRNRLAFDIDGVVADIMTTFLDLVRERYDQGHHFRYEHITTFFLEDCLDLPSWIIAEVIRELIDRPHELPVAPFPHAVPVLTRLAQETPLLFVTARDRKEPIEHWLHRKLAPVPPVTPTPKFITFSTTASSTSWKTAWKPACNWPTMASPPSCSPNPGTAYPTRFRKSRVGRSWAA
jgi:hypothetical protein